MFNLLIYWIYKIVWFSSSYVLWTCLTFRCVHYQFYGYYIKTLKFVCQQHRAWLCISGNSLCLSAG
jgi:hypothetical protein